MIKNCVFAVALLSLALAGGCAKGGNGIAPPQPGVAVTAPTTVDPSSMYPTQSVTLTATVSNSTNTAVTWSLGPAATCTGTPNPCGTLTPVTPAPTPATATYVAPATPISGVTVTATLVGNSSVAGTLQVIVIPVSVVVTPTGTPTVVSVGQNLMQQFTAFAFPQDAPQTFTWSVTCTSGANCGTIVQDQNISGLAVYTAGSVDQSVVVSATSAVAQSSPGVGQAKVTVAATRLPAGTYSFQFSGYDNSNNPVASAGSFILASNGTITAGGVEDVLSVVPPQTQPQPQQYPITSVSYSPSSNSNISNNLGTLTLNLSNGIINTYTAVLTSSGIIRMIESDTLGTGSGIMQKVTSDAAFNAGAQNFALGFTGVDSSGGRVGYVGLLPLNGSGGIGSQTIPGLLDDNDNGSATSVCSSPPCSIATTSSYSQTNANLPTYWNMTLTTGSITQHFDFFVSAGTTQTKTGPGALTLYAISTDPVDATHPALSGSMVYQVPLTSYDNAAFSGTSVSNLTGANGNVSLTLGTTDGTSGGTGGTGGFTGTFDWNNNGTIIAVPPPAPPPPAQQCEPPTVCTFSYTYVASSGNTGRYIFQMLGNPNPPVTKPLPFVLYASGANRGFLLDQSSSAVMTGTMNPQPANALYAPTGLPGTFAAAPISNSDSSLPLAVENLLFTSPEFKTYSVAGTQNPDNVSLSGTYALTTFGTGAGVGTITLTAPAAATYVIYAIDTTTVPNPATPSVPDVVITDFMMMGTCTIQAPSTTCSSGPPSSIIFAQE